MLTSNTQLKSNHCFKKDYMWIQKSKWRPKI